MPPHIPFRRRLELTGAAAWGVSASLALLVGCVDAPGPVTSDAPATAVDVAFAEPALADNSLSATATTPATEVTPTPAETPDPDGWVASPITVSASQPVPSESIGPPAPEPTLAEPTLVEPTLAEPTPLANDSAPSLLPGELSSTSPTPEPESSTPAPFPTSADPTLTESESDHSAPLPTPATASATESNPTISEGNPKPLEMTKPRSLILISPRNVKPLVGPQTASTETPHPSTEQPAVILPASPAADAALLSPLEARPSVGNPDTMKANVAATSLASLDPQSSLPSLPTPADTKPLPTPSAGPGETPVTSISISRPITELPPGFTALFNNKDLTGWEVYDGKPDAWQFKDGEVSCVTPGGGWLQTLTLYTDFELRFEYRLSPGGNSGVCLRFPGHGNPSLEGLEIQLLDDRADKYQSIQAQQATGSLYFVTAPQVRDAARVAGEWNQCTIRCMGNQLQVTINDQLVNEIDLGQLASKTGGASPKPAPVRCPMGSIALQSHTTQIDFRQVGIRDLTQALESGVRWLDLQAGAGEPVPAGAKVTVHYIGFLSTGKRFANSFEKNKPVTVPLKDVIPGWREGIPGMQVGGKRRLIVPAAMAYGAKGFKEIVPPNSTLVYEIELTGFEKPTEPEKAPVTAEAGRDLGTVQ